MSKIETEPIVLPNIINAVRLPVTATNGMITNDLRASLIRERDLESQTNRLINAPSVIVDLSEITSLTAQAAFELIGQWMWNVQIQREKAGKESIPVIITAKYLDILRTVHAAIRDSRQTAYALIPKELTDGKNIKLVKIGRITA